MNSLNFDTLKTIIETLNKLPSFPKKIKVNENYYNFLKELCEYKCEINGSFFHGIPLEIDNNLTTWKFEY